jgi:hypothetical protein
MKFELSCGSNKSLKNLLTTNLTMTFEEEDLYRVVANMEYFLRSCGYDFDKLILSVGKKDYKFSCGPNCSCNKDTKIDFDSNSHVI